MSKDDKRLSKPLARDVRKTDARPAAVTGKKTKRWCRGKIGVEHVVAVMRSSVGYAKANEPPFMYTRYCTACGKNIASFFDFSFAGKKLEPPEWVVAYKKENGWQ